MSNITPGKWEADEEGEYVFTRTPFNLEMVAQMRGWGYLTSSGKAGLHLSAEEAIEVQKANARLIAAAPEMYELLKEELIPTSDYGGILSFSREAKLRELFARIDGEEKENDGDK